MTEAKALTSELGTEIDDGTTGRRATRTATTATGVSRLFEAGRARLGTLAVGSKMISSILSERIPDSVCEGVQVNGAASL